MADATETAVTTQTFSTAGGLVQTPPPQATDENTLRGLRMLFRIAERYWAQGAIRQALELYIEIYDKYGYVPEAEPAHQRLMEIAEWFESRGDVHQARALVERIM